MLSSAEDNLSYTLGAQLGRCSSGVYMQMCDEGLPTWHVYFKANYNVTEFIRVVGEVDHYSSWDGEADLHGYTDQQSGSFDYVGVGIEINWR
jgi:hypothetical protein